MGVCVLAPNNYCTHTPHSLITINQASSSASATAATVPRPTPSFAMDVAGAVWSRRSRPEKPSVRCPHALSPSTARASKRLATQLPCHNAPRSELEVTVAAPHPGDCALYVSYDGDAVPDADKQ